MSRLLHSLSNTAMLQRFLPFLQKDDKGFVYWLSYYSHFLLIQDVCGADENLKDQAQVKYYSFKFNAIIFITASICQLSPSTE